MSRVVFSEEATTYLNDLILLLLKKDCFSFKETAENYVNDLVDFITDRIDTAVKRPAPARFKKYGDQLQYIIYKRNKHTSWYIFFIQKGDKFLITHVTNNHVAAKHLRGL